MLRNLSSYVIMCIYYFLECMLRWSVFRWCSYFCKGRSSTDDRVQPGHANVIFTQEAIAAVDSTVRNNQRITTPYTVNEMSMSKRNVPTILHKYLQYKKICARWIPKHLTQEQTSYHIGCPGNNLCVTMKWEAISFHGLLRWWNVLSSH